jgi:nucleotide-binding universal stress UspA family protein
MIKTILTATDGSRVAAKAVKFAADLAAKLGASVTVLGVADLSQLIAPVVAPAVTTAKVVMETKDILKQAAVEYADRAASDLKKKGLRVRRVVRTGYPADEIVKEAKKSKAGLIVLGSHGRSAFTAAVLGSVAYRVIHKSTSIPVLVVRK